MWDMDPESFVKTVEILPASLEVGNRVIQLEKNEAISIIHNYFNKNLIGNAHPDDAIVEIIDWTSVTKSSLFDVTEEIEE
jgi:hypothetical protein